MARGFKTGGRKKGSRNKKKRKLPHEVQGRDLIARAVVEEVEGVIAFQGDAHAFLMVVYKDPAIALETRLDAAKAAVRYERPALASVESNVTVTDKRDATDWPRDELVRFLNDTRTSGNGAAAPGLRDDGPDILH